MKIGISDESAIQQITPGGWSIINALRTFVAGVTTSFHQEHTVDDRHATITATGSVSERMRTVPQGEWINIPYGSVAFTGNGSMTWTVQSTDQDTFKYMLIGKTLWLTFSFSTTTVGGTPNTQLFVPLPRGFISAVSLGTTFWYSDNGTSGVGRMQCAVGDTNVRLYLLGLGNWAASANNTSVQGQLAMEFV